MFELSILSATEISIIAAGFGLIIGSFLNVYIYRFHTGRSLAGSSHCMSCGEGLRWYELFPVISFLCLFGRCRTCGCRIPSRYALVESVTAVLFVLTALLFSNMYYILFWWIIMAILVVIVVYDINHYIIPDSLVAALTLLLAGYLSVELYYGRVSESIGWDVFAAACASLFFFTLWFVSKGTWLGFGDVKLAFPLGLIVGADLVFSMVVFSFWIGTVISLVLVGYAALERGKLGLRSHGHGLTMKSVVPFAPFLIAGCLLVFFTNINVISIFSF